MAISRVLVEDKERSTVPLADVIKSGRNRKFSLNSLIIIAHGQYVRLTYWSRGVLRPSPVQQHNKKKGAALKKTVHIRAGHIQERSPVLSNQSAGCRVKGSRVTLALRV